MSLGHPHEDPIDYQNKKTKKGPLGVIVYWLREIEI
jgi:hypothetical protein